MAFVQIVAAEQFIGSSGDTKPTDGSTSVRRGATAYEVDTSKTFYTPDGVNWLEGAGAGAVTISSGTVTVGGGTSNVNVLGTTTARLLAGAALIGTANAVLLANNVVIGTANVNVLGTASATLLAGASVIGTTNTNVLGTASVTVLGTASATLLTGAAVIGTTNSNVLGTAKVELLAGTAVIGIASRGKRTLLTSGILGSDTAVKTSAGDVYWLSMSDTAALSLQLNDGTANTGSDKWGMDVTAGGYAHMIFDPPIEFGTGIYLDVNTATCKVTVGYI